MSAHESRNVARPRGEELLLGGAAERLADRVRQLVDGRLQARGDVEDVAGDEDPASYGATLADGVVRFSA